MTFILNWKKILLRLDTLCNRSLLRTVNFKLPTIISTLNIENLDDLT